MQPSIDIVHQVHGRARLRVTEADDAAYRRLEQRLGALGGVSEVRVNALTGSVLVCFDDSWTAGMLALEARAILQSEAGWLPMLDGHVFCHWPRLPGYTQTLSAAHRGAPQNDQVPEAPPTTLPLRERTREVGGRFWRRKLGLENHSGWMRLAGAGFTLLQIATRWWLGPVAADLLLWGLLLASIPLSATLLDLTLQAIEPLKIPLDLFTWFAQRRQAAAQNAAPAAPPAPTLAPPWADVIPLHGGLTRATQAA